MITFLMRERRMSTKRDNKKCPTKSIGKIRPARNLVLIAALLLTGTASYSEPPFPMNPAPATTPQATPAAKSNNQESPRKVYALPDREAMKQLLSDKETVAYIANAIGASGMGTGRPDPVLMRMLQENAAQAQYSVAAPEEKVAERKDEPVK